MTDDLDRRLNPFRYDGDGNLTEAARRQDGTLRPDSAAPAYAGGGNVPSLFVSPDLLNDRADRTDDTSAEFVRVCRAPLNDTAEVAKGLKGFRSASAFAVLQQRWDDEVTYVGTKKFGAFARDLRDGATSFRTRDIDTAGTFGVN